MKTNLCVFSESDNQKSSLLEYYGKKGKKEYTAGSGWYIGGIHSTNNSPEPTPPSSPIANHKSMRMDFNMDCTIEKFSNLLSCRSTKEEDDFAHKFVLYFSSTGSLSPKSLSRTSTLPSIPSNELVNNFSWKDLPAKNEQETKPIPFPTTIPKNKKG